MTNDKVKLYAVHITTFGLVETIEYPHRTQFQDEEPQWLKKQVGGKLEICDNVRTGNGTTMLLNEEGKMIGLPHNAIAQELLKLQNDFIVGDVLIVETTEEDIHGLDKERALDIMQMINELILKKDINDLNC